MKKVLYLKFNKNILRYLKINSNRKSLFFYLSLFLLLIQIKLSKQITFMYKKKLKNKYKNV